jgi:hypothetical protein
MNVEVIGGNDEPGYSPIALRAATVLGSRDTIRRTGASMHAASEKTAFSAVCWSSVTGTSILTKADGRTFPVKNVLLHDSKR